MYIDGLVHRVPAVHRFLDSSIATNYSYCNDQATIPEFCSSVTKSHSWAEHRSISFFTNPRSIKRLIAGRRCHGLSPVSADSPT